MCTSESNNCFLNEADELFLNLILKLGLPRIIHRSLPNLFAWHSKMQMKVHLLARAAEDPMQIADGLLTTELKRWEDSVNRLGLRIAPGGELLEGG